ESQGRRRARRRRSRRSRLAHSLHGLRRRGDQHLLIAGDRRPVGIDPRVRRLHAGDVMQLAPSPWDCLLFDWEFDPVVVLALAVTAVLYARGLIALRRRGTRAPGRRKVALFAGGWLTLVVALVSPVHEVSEQLFTVHMIE